jgi:hypothetical protein
LRDMIFAKLSFYNRPVAAPTLLCFSFAVWH